MAPNDKAGRVVFIGNIPYGTPPHIPSNSTTHAPQAHTLAGITEEQIIETLGRVGQVLNFRLVYDKETGRPKGFGFAEFADGDAAASAVRNLNDYEIMGRKLRVDWSNDNGAGDSAPNAYAPAPATAPVQPEPAAPSAAIANLPQGTGLDPGLTFGDAISKTLNTLPPSQLLDILQQMKQLVMTDQARATELLSQAPQLSYALFQALLLLNLVDGTALNSVVVGATAPQPTAAPPQPAPAPQHNYPGYPPQPTATPTPAPAPAAYTPQPPQPPLHMHPALAGLAPEQQAQYLQILAIPVEQLAGLDPAQREQVLTIRKTFGL